MPYIKQEDRARYGDFLHHACFIQTKGELEYLVFSLMKWYMENHKTCYADLHDCVYAVQHCSDEFRRRFLDAREDKAQKENGDILMSDPIPLMSDSIIASEELAKDKFLSKPIAEE